MVSFTDIIFWSMIDAFKGGSNWSIATKIWQNVRHAFGIPALTKSRFGKIQSYKVSTPLSYHNQIFD